MASVLHVRMGPVAYLLVFVVAFGLVRRPFKNQGLIAGALLLVISDRPFCNLLTPVLVIGQENVL